MRRCARCGRVHESTDTMRQVVAYNCKKLVWVCYDDRNCKGVMKCQPIKFAR